MCRGDRISHTEVRLPAGWPERSHFPESSVLSEEDPASGWLTGRVTCVWRTWSPARRSHDRLAGRKGHVCLQDQLSRTQVRRRLAGWLAGRVTCAWTEQMTQDNVTLPASQPAAGPPCERPGRPGTSDLTGVDGDGRPKSGWVPSHVTFPVTPPSDLQARERGMKPLLLCRRRMSS